MAPQQNNAADEELWTCGCSKCKKKGMSQRKRSTWYRHQSQRDADVRNGLLPARSAHTKRAREEDPDNEQRNTRLRSDSGTREEDRDAAQRLDAAVPENGVPRRGINMVRVSLLVLSVRLTSMAGGHTCGEQLHGSW